MKTPNAPEPRIDPGLYLVATPIGNARDITLRAMDVLAGADLLAAEDTRNTRNLLNILGIARDGATIIAYHDHNGAAQRPRILKALEAGKSVALVSDAGTPMVADPGFPLARAAIEAGFNVIAIPGASAVLAALTVSGLPTDRFMFAGFLPPKSAARKKVLADLATAPASLVFYESPRRLADVLPAMAEILGLDRDCAVSRELTKKFEETRRGTLGDLADHYATAPAPKGEVVIVLGPPVAQDVSPEVLDTALKSALVEASVKDAAREIAARFDLPRRAVYARALELSQTR